MYDNATLCIKTQNGLTDSVNINKGVLQGEILSPLLFSLFISDLEAFFIAHGCRGVSIDHLHEVIILAYDLIILANSQVVMRRKLSLLKEYCNLNNLNINGNKTKIVIFQKGAHFRNKDLNPFMLGDREIKVVSEYKYLRVIFSQNDCFLKAWDETLHSAKAACGASLALISRLNTKSWKVIEALLQSLVLVWALRYLDDIERIQLYFYKRILNLPQNTPGGLA